MIPVETSILQLNYQEGKPRVKNSEVQAQTEIILQIQANPDLAET